MSLFLDEKECVEYLKSLGYRVHKVYYDVPDKIKKVKDLLRFFYDRMVYYNPDRKYPHTIDYDQDTKFLSSLIKAREKLGLGRSEAIKESAKIIDVLLKHEKSLNLKQPITGPSILTSRPIIDWTCSILNKENAVVREEDRDRLIEEFNFNFSKKFAQEDFEKASEDRKKIMESLDGKGR